MSCNISAEVGQEQVFAFVEQDTVFADVACGEFSRIIDTYIDFNVEPNNYVDFEGNTYIDF